MFGPPINDITTDLNDPPAFPVGQIGPAPASFKPLQAASYNDLRPILNPRHSPGQVFDSALRLASSLPRWSVTFTDKPAGLIQGTAKTRVFRFTDDWVIRVRAMPGGGPGSVVDMRSRSRVGKGDLGANAARISNFLGSLGTELLAIEPNVNE